MALVEARRSLALVMAAIVAAVLITSAAGSSKWLNITNSCGYTVWPAISTGASSAAPDTTGFELAPGQWEMVPVPSGWRGRVWGRTFCSSSTTDSSGKFTCLTGDCGSGKQDCAGGNAAPPVTLAQFTLDGNDGGMDTYDVSLVDGFNLPLLVAPQGAAAGGNCAPTGCVADLNAACPAELRVTSAPAGTGTVACNSACLAFGSPQYCCTGEYGNPDTCKPSAYSQLFKKACPPAYSYAYDGAAGSTFTCACGDTCTYTITFCLSPTSGKPLTSPNSEPPGKGNPPLINAGSTTPYTGGDSQGDAAASAPWRIVLAVAVFGLVTAALGVLAQFLDLFKLCFSCSAKS